MKRARVIAAATMACISTLANADQPVGSVGLGQLSDSGISLGYLYATGGYEFDTGTPNFTITPEVRLGFGVADDTVLGANVKLDNIFGVNVRGQWDFPAAYVFVAPSYTRAKFSASFGGFSASDSSWEFGGGLGAGYKLSRDLAVEASWENFSGTDIYSLGLRYRFNQ